MVHARLKMLIISVVCMPGKPWPRANRLSGFCNEVILSHFVLYALVYPGKVQVKIRIHN